MINGLAENKDEIPQGSRNQFGEAIAANDIELVRRMLTEEPLLANLDLRSAENRDVFTNGLPLFRACKEGHEEIAELLLQFGAHPDAPGRDPDDQPELGMPLHFAVHGRNYRLANQILNRGATPNGYPHCDQSTMEILFYQVREKEIPDVIVRRAYSPYLPDREQLSLQTMTELVGEDANEPLALFARMFDAGGKPPLCALVREGLHDLVVETVVHSQDDDGSPHDHPNSTVFDNVCGAARWYGYPKLLSRLMKQFPKRFDYESAIGTIGVAIGSHNRDGGFPEYREIIVMQLEFLKSRGDLEEALEDPDFKPLYEIATDFCWHSNYGFKADIVKPECYIDLAELFVSWGFNDINWLDPKTRHSALSAAVKRGHHPGISTYIQWLVDHGADLRESEVDELNPCVMARQRGFDRISQILENAKRTR